MVKAVVLKDGKAIGHGHPCFIIAEAGVNHNGSLKKALKLVDAAKEAGADAVKFQLYHIEEQISQDTSTAVYQHKQTEQTTMQEMAKTYELEWEAHRDIAAYCHEIGITYLASCFEPKAIDFLLGLGAEFLKVASGEITNYPLLAHASSTGAPILLSTGMSSLEDVAGAVTCIRNNGESPLALFHCVSNYPADPATANLRAIHSMEMVFGLPVGFSDHTEGNAVAAVAVAMGACMLEKHFTLDRTLPGPDHAMSLNPQQLADFVEVVRIAEVSLGDGVKKIYPHELEIRKVARRSLVSVKSIQVGEALNSNNTTLKRPATGIDPRVWQAVRGRKAVIVIPPDTPITWEMLE